MHQIEEDNDGTPYFDSLPPEMVTAVLEFVEPCPKDILNCRVLNHRFRVLTDEILKSRVSSAWRWSRSTGESKPTSGPGPVKLLQPSLPPFEDNKEITRFLRDFGGACDIPGGAINIRRVRRNLPPTSATGGDEDITLSQLMSRSRAFFEMNPDQGVISVQEIVNLLDKHGSGLSSLVLEGGVTTELSSEDLITILELVPNLECLMLKGCRVRDPGENHLPPLPHLKHLKIIYCQNITEKLISAYHSQLESLQVVNGRDSKLFPQFSFPQLKSLKIGDLDKLQEDFDSLETWFEKNPPPKLLQLAVYYPMFDKFGRYCQKLFGSLKHLPRLDNFHLGNGARQSFALAVHNPLGGASILEEPDKTNFPLSKITKLTLPIEMFFHLESFHQILTHFKTVRSLTVLDCDRRLWDARPEHVDQMLGLTEPNLAAVLKQWLVNYDNLTRVSIVTSYGGEERLIAEATK